MIIIELPCSGYVMMMQQGLTQLLHIMVEIKEIYTLNF